MDTASLEEIFSQYFVPHYPLSWTTQGTSTTSVLMLDMSGIRSTLTPVAPLSILNGALSIDLTAYRKTSSLAAYAPKFTALLPLTLSASKAISMDLSAYHGKITASAPLAMSATDALSVDLSPYALASSLSSYALSSALSSYAPKISVASPITFSGSNALAIDLSGYQKTMSATTPLSIAHGTISIALTAYQNNFIVGPPLLMTETTTSSGCRRSASI